MNDGIALSADLLRAAACGGLLGGAYFGGLWLTLRRAPASRHPALLMLASLLLRLAGVGFGLYWLANGDWRRYLAAVAGILLARWLWIRRIEPKRKPA